MSVIVIVLDKNSMTAQAVMKLHRVLGTSVQLLKAAWSKGEPILEVEIFEGDYQSHAKVIRAVLSVIAEEKLTAEYFGIPYGEQYAGNTKLDVWRIDMNVVSGILESADEEAERQLNS
jgi:hypothetical protein